MGAAIEETNNKMRTSHGRSSRTMTRNAHALARPCARATLTARKPAARLLRQPARSTNGSRLLRQPMTELPWGLNAGGMSRRTIASAVAPPQLRMAPRQRRHGADDSVTSKQLRQMAATKPSQSWTAMTSRLRQPRRAARRQEMMPRAILQTNDAAWRACP